MCLKRVFQIASFYLFISNLEEAFVQNHAFLIIQLDAFQDDLKIMSHTYALSTAQFMCANYLSKKKA